MTKIVSRAVVLAAMLLGAAACGYDTSATFNSDGSVTVGLKFLLPKSLMTPGPGVTVHGMSPADIAAANKQLQSKYPGGSVTTITEGDEAGAQVTIPFKTEKEAFAFLTSPPQLTPSGATSGNASINLSNTGGLFTSATHTTSGANDTYTFRTSAATMPSPSPGGQTIAPDEIESMFTIRFSLTVPHVITSAPGALFSLDHKTAVWKLQWTKAETLTATTGPDVALAGYAAGTPVEDYRLVIVVGFIAVAAGFVAGMFAPWRRAVAPKPAAVSAPGGPPAVALAPAPPPVPAEPVAWPGPPDVPPPYTPPTG